MKFQIIIIISVIVGIGYLMVNIIKKHGLLDVLAAFFIILAILGILAFYKFIKMEATHG